MVLQADEPPLIDCKAVHELLTKFPEPSSKYSGGCPNSSPSGVPYTKMQGRCGLEPLRQRKTTQTTP